MKRFIKNIVLLAIPFIVYFVAVMIIDPFNYLDKNTLVDASLKKDISDNVEPHLYRLIDYQNHPLPNIMLGDSRTNDLWNNSYRGGWSNLSYVGGTLKEMIETFWWVAGTHKLDTVIMGVSLHLYNKVNQRFWVQESLERKSNLFSYAFNRYTFSSSWLILKSLIHGESEDVNPMTFTPDEFWKYQIEVFPKKYLKKYVYPGNYFRELQKISDYCRDHGIALVFWIPPTHTDFQKKVTGYGLDSANEAFRHDLFSLGDVYDFDFDSELTRKRENFFDPLHFNNDRGKEVAREVLDHTLRYSRFYGKATSGD